jgi:DNA (cytosine-5)-methyltransferase 1
MMSNRRCPDDTVRAVDLFCGAGGLSAGLALACEQLDRDVELAAVNHWGTAIETHKQNHPWADHYNAKIEELDPREVYPGERVDILTGGPECTHFSTARGGRPVNEQKRASPWRVLEWLQKLYVDNFLIENVPEFIDWGPVGADGTPMQSKKGETFEAWINAIHSLGYSVDWQVLNAADYGDATSRERLFIVGRRQHRPEFPDPSHSEGGDQPGTRPWRPAAEIIDWSAPGKSIWTRSRPLVNNTMQRIAEGIRRHGSDRLERVADVVGSLGKDDVEALQERVVPASKAHLAAEALDSPFFVRAEVAVGQPVAPHLVKYYGTSTARPLDAPVDTITANGQKFGLCVPYLLGQQSNALPLRVDQDPVPTIATRGAISKITPRPFVLPRNGYHRGLHSNPAYDPAARPLHTVTAKNTDGHVVRPTLMQFSHGGKLLDEDAPLPTITTAKGGVFVTSQPYLIEYYGNGQAQPLTEPLPTVTTKDRFALVVPECYPLGIDIRFRMLQPRELAAAMGFPSDYEFCGTQTETTEQIGNAVPVNLAQALCERLLEGDDPTLCSYTDDPPPAATDGGTGGEDDA